MKHKGGNLSNVESIKYSLKSMGQIISEIDSVEE